MSTHLLSTDFVHLTVLVFVVFSTDVSGILIGLNLPRYVSKLFTVVYFHGRRHQVVNIDTSYI